jgi:hypothetical protein
VLRVEDFFLVLVEVVVFFPVVLRLLEDVPVDLPALERVDLLDFFADALAAKSFSAASMVKFSTDSPSGREALVFPCLT